MADNFDFYEAKNSTHPAPLLVFVHGGAWITGDKSQYRDFATKLANLGLCVATLNYTLSNVAPHPRPVQELEEFLNSLSQKAKSPKCDSKKIFLMGHSAGAHMIAFWAATHQNSSVRGFIGLEGLYDVQALVKRRPIYAEQFITAEFGDAKNWLAASPTHLKMRTLAPWLLVHATTDELIETEQSHDFLAHLQKQNIKAQFLELKEGTHFGVVRTAVETGSLLQNQLLHMIQE